MVMKKKKSNPVIKNRRATFDYFIIDTWTAGLQLMGTEVKSLRAGKCNLTDSYCYFKNNELFVKGMEIQTGTSAFQHEPNREKKLLLNRSELTKISKSLMKGMTLIPLKVHIINNFFKIDIAIAKGKKLYDKRETIKERDLKRSDYGRD
jgi:SsrA-binding protein